MISLLSEGMHMLLKSRLALGDGSLVSQQKTRGVVFIGTEQTQCFMGLFYGRVVSKNRLLRDVHELALCHGFAAGWHFNGDDASDFWRD